MPWYSHSEEQANATPGGLLAWETVQNSTWDHTFTISRIHAFWTTRNELLKPNGRQVVFDSVDTFSVRLRWREHKLILTRPPNMLARVESGSGSQSYQGNRNLLSAICLIQNPYGTKKHPSSQELPLGCTYPCFPAGGPTRCLLPFATLQVVQKVCLFTRNVSGLRLVLLSFQP